MSYFTCAQKLTEASVVYHAEPTRKTEKKQGKETKNKKNDRMSGQESVRQSCGRESMMGRICETGKGLSWK